MIDLQAMYRIHNIPNTSTLPGSVLAILAANAQDKPPALQNVTISSVQDGDYYSLHVDFDYSGTGTCQCLVKTVQGRKKASFGTIKKCGLFQRYIYCTV